VTVRFLADEDLDSDIVEGLRFREPAIDVLDVKRAGMRGTPDATLLDLAAQQGRILITHDRRTMTRHFRDRQAAGKSSPGVFVVPQRSAIGEVVESLLLAWAASRAEEWWEQIVYLPFRRSRLAREGASIEVVDLRTLLPLDRETVLASVKKTSKVLLLHEDTRTGGIAGELAVSITESIFEYLDVPIVRVTAPDTPVPFSPTLEEAFLPNTAKVVEKARWLWRY
jgi:hypothetical protein